MSFTVRLVAPILEAVGVSQKECSDTQALEYTFEVEGKEVVYEDDLYDFMAEIGEQRKYSAVSNYGQTEHEQELSKAHALQVCKEINETMPEYIVTPSESLDCIRVECVNFGSTEAQELNKHGVLILVQPFKDRVMVSYLHQTPAQINL